MKWTYKNKDLNVITSYALTLIINNLDAAYYTQKRREESIRDQVLKRYQ